jgi:nucleotide sugar dehydrogenase
MESILKLAAVASPDDSIDNVVRSMAQSSRGVKYPGIAVILDKHGKLKGMLTDGDIRRAYASNIQFTDKVSKVMIKDPIVLSSNTPPENILDEIQDAIKSKARLHVGWVRHVLFVDKDFRLIRILDYLELLQNNNMIVDKVAVIGMGYVGLTMAVFIANQGYKVEGIDIKKKLIHQLQKGEPHVHESGLEDMLNINLQKGFLRFNESLSGHQNIYLVAVGTPLDTKNKPDMTHLKNVLKEIAKFLKKNDQVMLRSTVPVGITRQFVVPFLEIKTKLIAGKDFSVSFVPERTVEGDAMNELRNLPQVIGGFSKNCLKRSVEFWSNLVPTVVRAPSMEAAEMVKLANNTYRDLSFAFSNEIALLADEFNIDAADLINIANEGYPRNPIPLPSPGVGGYCLSKDPIIYGSKASGGKNIAKLGDISRKINRNAALYPIEKLNIFIKKNDWEFGKISLVIMGIAFKGNPETADVRSSVAIDLIHKLEEKVSKIIVWDAVLKNNDLAKLGLRYTNNLKDSISKAQAVLILNNHPGNITSEVLTPSNKGRLIFDGWRQFNSVEVEKIKGLTYSTMGYTSVI